MAKKVQKKSKTRVKSPKLARPTPRKASGIPSGRLQNKG